MNKVNKKKDCILNLYPEPDKLSNSDPRKNYMDKSKIGCLPSYAFPLGFEPKFQTEKPQHTILPMIFNAGEDITYLQYLIFYENLET